MSEVAMLPCMMSKLQMMIKPNRVKTLIMKKSSKTCPICMQGFKQEELIKQLPCKHIYHRCCIKQWMKKSTECPLCRNHFHS